MSLALEMRDARIRVVEFDGRASEATVFLHAVAGVGDGPETIGERLNDSGLAFLPVRRGDDVELLNLAWVAYVAVSGRPPEVAAREEIGALRARVELDLATRETLAGELLYTLPPGNARVSDLLNSVAERFLLLVAERETLFVNRAAIVRARGA